MIKLAIPITVIMTKTKGTRIANLAFIFERTEAIEARDFPRYLMNKLDRACGESADVVQ